MRIVGLAAAMVILAASASAGTLYMVRTSDDMLRELNTDTLQIKDVGTLGVPFDFGGLAYDGSKMYMVQGFAGNNLYTVDMNSGAASLVGSHGFADMFGLAYDPTTQELYGGRSTTGKGFYSLNRTNGSAKFIGDPGINLDGLAYDSKRDQVVGGDAGPGDLYKIDRNNGSAALLYNGDFFNNCGLAYDSEKDAYWMVDWSGNLYTFDPNNGYARKLMMSGLGAHDGMEFIPEPASALLLLAGALLLRRR